jgi:DNA-binding CsgD family transcriptional regulator
MGADDGAPNDNIGDAACREAERRLRSPQSEGREHYAVVADFALAPSPDSSGRVHVVVVERSDLPPMDAAAVAKAIGLTSREAEVALALAARRSSAEIARALGISPHTARRHAERVLDKLGVRSRREVAEALTRQRVLRG